MIIFNKAGHTVIMPNSPQNSSRVSDNYVMWIYYLDDTDETSRRVNVGLQHSCMLTTLTRAEPKTREPNSCCCVQGWMWSDIRLSCYSACRFKPTCSAFEDRRCTFTAHRPIPKCSSSVTVSCQTISRQFKKDQ